MRSHLLHGQRIKCPTPHPGNVVNLILPRLRHYVRSFFLGAHLEILSCALRTHYGRESLFNTCCRYKLEINHVIVCVSWHYFNPASHCWWKFSTICQRWHNSPTRTTYHHTCSSNLSGQTWPGCAFNISRYNRLHNTDLNTWYYPRYGSWIGFQFTVAYPGSGIWLSENFFLDPWFCSQGYITGAC